MEQISFSKLFDLIPSIYRNQVVKYSVNKNKRKITSHWFVDVPKEFHGFRDINKVPENQLVKKILKDGVSSDELARIVLNIWFEENQGKVVEIINSLEKNGYAVAYPNFDLSDFSYELLDESHSISIDDRNYVNFSEIDKPIEQRFEETLICVLLGWYPTLGNEGVNYSRTKSEKIIENKNSIDIEDSNYNESVLTLTEEIELLNKLKLDYTNTRTEIVQLLDSCKSVILKHQNDFEEQKIYRVLENYRKTNSDLCNYVIKCENSIKENHNNISQKLRDDDFIDYKAENDLLKRTNGITEYYNLLRKKCESEFNQDCQLAMDLILQLDDVRRNSLSKRITEIQLSLKDLSLDTSSKLLEEIKLIKSNVEEEIKAFNLEVAVKEFYDNNTSRSEKCLVKYISEKGTKDDILIFFVFLTIGADCLSAELKQKLLVYINQYLRDETIDNIVTIFNEEGITNLFSSFREGQLFLSLIAIILSLNGRKERASAILFNENNYESLSDYSGLMRIGDRIALNNDFKPFFSKQDEISKKIIYLKNIFSLDDTYQKIAHGIEKKFRDVIEQNVLVALSEIFDEILITSHENFESIKKKLNDTDLVQDLYSKAKSRHSLPQNRRVDDQIFKFLEKIVSDLNNFLELRTYECEFENEKFISLKDIEASIHLISCNYHTLQPTCELLLQNITKAVSPEIIESNISLEFHEFLSQKILVSSFFNRHCPELIKKLFEGKLSKDEIIITLIENISDKKSNREILDFYTSNRITFAAQIISPLESDGSLDKIFDAERNYLDELLEFENYLISQSMHLPQEYSVYKEFGRWGLCSDLLIGLKSIVLEKKRKSSEEMAVKLKDLGIESAKIRMDISLNRDKYQETTLLLFFKALQIVDDISIQKQSRKIEIAERLLEEIKHIIQFNNESLDEFIRLLSEADQKNNPEIEDKYSYQKTSLIDLLKYTEEDKYSALGLTMQQWLQISSDRKDDIMDLLESWIYLKTKPTTKEDIKKNKPAESDITSELKKLVTSLASICSLYRTNDNNRIGQDPFSDWNTSTDLPFTYTTKLKSPRCSSLDKPIRFYVISESQILSKKYISRIKDFVIEKSYDSYGFNIFILLGERDKFNMCNTYSVTKDYAVLDEEILKKILYSTAEKKPPKWEFVSLITLNKKISTIQPFKTQGSVDSDTGIFVGRKDIIKEITNSQKDYAIFGGRKIGKSSLLSELSKTLKLSDVAVSNQSFQGLDSSLAIAKAILEDLKVEGLKYSPLIPVQSLDDFYLNLLNFYRNNDSKRVTIIIDELDELINIEKNTGKHQIIELFRNLSHTTNHLWRFIFAGYKEMFLEIHGKGVYEQWRSPWENFVDDSNKQLPEIESPREVIDEGLRNILGLEYDKEVVDLIINYSTGHPAFLQKFCECLVNSIDQRISPSERRVYKEDVIKVFEKDSEFISYVKETLELNLSDYQRAIILIAAIEKKEVFSFDWVKDKLSEWVEAFGKDIRIDDKDLETEMDLLSITSVIKKTSNTFEYKFTHPHYIQILHKLENVDKNMLENSFKKIEQKKHESITT